MFSSPRYVSFVIRILLDERGKMLRGKVVQVQDDRELYFQDWAELIQVVEGKLRAPAGRELAHTLRE